jgi:rhodanese-related sulfurtransferase
MARKAKATASAASSEAAPELVVVDVRVLTEPEKVRVRGADGGVIGKAGDRVYSVGHDRWLVPSGVGVKVVAS